MAHCVSIGRLDHMIKDIANFFDGLMRKYTPDPFVLAFFLTITTLGLGLWVTPFSFEDMISFWGEGFWSLTPFTMQIIMIFVGGFSLSTTPPVKKFLRHVAQKMATPSQAVYFVTLISCLGCWLNWGFGLVMAGLLCREVVKVMPHVNFRLLVASAYSGFLVWHGGLSGSIPLTVATPGHFNEKSIGYLIPVSDTVFSFYNLAIVAGLMIFLPLTNWYLSRTEGASTSPFVLPEDPSEHLEKPQLEPAERLEYSRLLVRSVGALGLTFLVLQVWRGRCSLELNNVCFLLLFASAFFHRNLKAFIKSIDGAVGRSGAIILQFPFYAGIMGILKGSGLAISLSEIFVKISTAENYSLLTFYVSALLNLFIPSGGGQWAVQSPVVIATAKALGADLPRACMAVAWGDAWTNMIQPFWALPLLAIAGLKLRDIMGYCLISLIVSGLIISAGLMWL